MATLQSLDLNLLRALDALLDERSVTLAAARIGVTQPAMSGMLTRLREAFGDPLFVRTQRGITPTQRALELAGPVRGVMLGIGGLLQPSAFEPGTTTATFTIAATDYALRAIAVPLLAALSQHAPGARVALVGVEHRTVQSQLERGQVDLALLTPESTPPDLHARPLFDEHYVCLVRADHPSTRTRRLSLKQFCDMDHALVSYSSDRFSGVTDRVLEELGVQRRVSLSVQNFLILPDILRATGMMAVVPSRLAHGLEGMAVLKPPLAIPGFTKTMAWHERTHRDPAHRWLRALLAEVCGQPRKRLSGRQGNAVA